MSTVLPDPNEIVPVRGLDVADPPLNASCLTIKIPWPADTPLLTVWSLYVVLDVPIVGFQTFSVANTPVYPAVWFVRSNLKYWAVVLLAAGCIRAYMYCSLISISITFLPVNKLDDILFKAIPLILY